MWGWWRSSAASRTWDQWNPQRETGTLRLEYWFAELHAKLFFAVLSTSRSLHLHMLLDSCQQICSSPISMCFTWFLILVTCSFYELCFVNFPCPFPLCPSHYGNYQDHDQQIGLLHFSEFRWGPFHVSLPVLAKWVHEESVAKFPPLSKASPVKICFTFSKPCSKCQAANATEWSGRNCQICECDGAMHWDTRMWFWIRWPGKMVLRAQPAIRRSKLNIP